MSRLKMAVLIGNGGRLRAIEAGTRQPDSRVQVELVVSFKRHSPGLEWARQVGLQTQYHRWADWKAQGATRAEFDQALAELLQTQGIELIVLAGWGLMLTPAFLAHFPERIINVHPALLTDTAIAEISLPDGTTLPVFRGNFAIEEAWETGVPITGCTVHYVTPEMDVGPVILQRIVPRLPEDRLEDLTDRVHTAEDEILPQAIELVAEKLVSSHP